MNLTPYTKKVLLNFQKYVIVDSDFTFILSSEWFDSFKGSRRKKLKQGNLWAKKIIREVIIPYSNKIIIQEKDDKL